MKRLKHTLLGFLHGIHIIPTSSKISTPNLSPFFVLQKYSYPHMSHIDVPTTDFYCMFFSGLYAISIEGICVILFRAIT